MPFTRHAPWVLHEAFNQGKWVLSDKIKQLITGESIQVNIKRGLQFEHVFRAPILWATNHPPSIRDASRAVASRMLVVPCNGGFDDAAPVGIAAEALAAGHASLADYLLEIEGPGILRWAIEGLRRLLARRHFDAPAEMAAVQRDIYDDANPAAEFLRDCCTFDPDRMLRITDMMAAYAVWFGEQHGEGLRVPSSKSIGLSIKALGDARIGIDREIFRTAGDRFYGGLVLNRHGLDYWRGADGSSAAKGRETRLSKAATDVNQDIPGSWNGEAPVKRMRRAHADHAERERRKHPPDPPPGDHDQSNDQCDDQSQIVTNRDALLVTINPEGTVF